MDNTEYTKKGTLRKRRKYSEPLTERKHIKKDNKRNKFYVKPPCNLNCLKKMQGKISEEQRKKLNSEFWELSNTEQKEFYA